MLSLLQDEGLKTLLQQEGLLRSGGGNGGDTSNNVVVAVRVRPISSLEIEMGSRLCIESRGTAKKAFGAAASTATQHQQQHQQQPGFVQGEESGMAAAGSADEIGGAGVSTAAAPPGVHSQLTLTCTEEQRRYNFGFHAVFGTTCTQRDVYENVGAQVVESVLDGFAGTVLGYGQTSGGKTFTISGPHSYVAGGGGGPNSGAQHSAMHFDPEHDLFDLHSPSNNSSSSKSRGKFSSSSSSTYVHPNAGIIPRAAHHIFERLTQIYGPQQQQQPFSHPHRASPSASSSSPHHQHLGGSSPSSSGAAAAAAHTSSPAPSLKLQPHQDYLVTLTFIEIYLDRVRDLIETSRTNLPIREKDGAFFVEHASEHVVTSPLDVLHLLERGTRNRVTGSSRMNDRSSRSHSILTLTVQRRHYNDEGGSGSGATSSRSASASPMHGGAVSAAAAATTVTTCGKLQLIDLAGSERLGKSNITAATQMDEACAINKSLSHLAEVIAAVLDGRQHVPYRSCALTKLLSSSLGGNAKCAIIVCCSPSSYNEQETLSSLRFGSAASGIRNRPSMNRLVTDEQLRRYIAKMWAALRLQERQLRAAGGGGSSGGAAGGESDGSSAMLILDDQQQQQHGAEGDDGSHFHHHHHSAAAAAAAAGRRHSNTLLSLSAMTPEHAHITAPGIGGGGVAGLTPTSLQQSPDALALQFVNHVARYGAALESNSRSASDDPARANNSNHYHGGNNGLLNLSLHNSSAGGGLRQFSPGAARSFQAEMNFALSHASIQFAAQQQQQEQDQEHRDGDGHAITDQPATSRETPTALGDGGEQAQQQQAKTDRYVSLLKEMSDAIDEIDAETDEADAALRDFDRRQQEKRLQRFLPEGSGARAASPPAVSASASAPSSTAAAAATVAALVERVRTLEAEKEALEMNLAVWQSTMRDMERGKAAAWAQLQQQSLNIAKLVAELDRERSARAKLERQLDEQQQREKHLLSLSHTLEGAGTNNVNNYNNGSAVPVTASPSLRGDLSLAGTPSVGMSRVASMNAGRWQQREHQHQQQQGGAVGGESDALRQLEEEEEQIMHEQEQRLAALQERRLQLQQQQQQQQQQQDSDTSVASASTAAVNATTNTVAAARSRSPLSLRAVEGLLQRATAAEAAAASATAHASRLAAEKERAEQEVAALKRQAHVMESRIIALRRVAEAERTVQHLSSGGHVVRLGTVFSSGHNSPHVASSPDASLSGSAVLAMSGQHHHQHPHDSASSGTPALRPRSAVLEDMEQLQQKTAEMQSAVERLQNRTKQLGVNT